MSGQVIHDVVIPIVSRIMVTDGFASSLGISDIRDPRLEEFLEEELRRLEHGGAIKGQAEPEPETGPQGPLPDSFPDAEQSIKKKNVD